MRCAALFVLFMRLCHCAMWEMIKEVCCNFERGSGVINLLIFKND